MSAATSRDPQAPHTMSSYRHQAAANSSYNTDFASPTDSEFSVGYDEPDYVRNWDYQRVAEWLRSINAGQYIELFRRNDITGANLIDLDSSLLKDMGIKKIGDRVRIGAQAKKFRYNEYQRKRESGRVRCNFGTSIICRRLTNDRRIARP